MNERILELADQAVEDSSSGLWNISDEFCIKFAELIIKECLDTIQSGIDNFRSHDPKGVENGQTALFYSYRNIQARFGMGDYKDQAHSGVEE